MGFSLIEVVLAIGVVGFAIVAILGIFPTALATNRSAGNEGRAAQLVRAISSTIDAQSNSFSNINCYGLTLDLTSLKTATGAPPQLLYASYPSPQQPTISTSKTDATYTIELRFNNDPPLNAVPTNLGTGKLNLIEIRIFGNSRTEGNTEFFYLARNKG